METELNTDKKAEAIARLKEEKKTYEEEMRTRGLADGYKHAHNMEYADLLSLSTKFEKANTGYGSSIDDLAEIVKSAGFYESWDISEDRDLEDSDYLAAWLEGVVKFYDEIQDKL